MRVLVLGATGMLGHKLYQTLSDSEHQVFGTTRRPLEEVLHSGLLQQGHILEGVDARVPETVERALLNSGAQAVVNCIGLIKPLAQVPKQ